MPSMKVFLGRASGQQREAKPLHIFSSNGSQGKVSVPEVPATSPSASAVKALMLKVSASSKAQQKRSGTHLVTVTCFVMFFALQSHFPTYHMTLSCLARRRASTSMLPRQGKLEIRNSHGLLWQ